MLVAITLLCAVVLGLACVLLRHLGGKKRKREQREMAQYVRRDVNSTAGWKEYQ